MALNGSLRNAHYKRGKKDCLPDLCNLRFDVLLRDLTVRSITVSQLRIGLLDIGAGEAYVKDLFWLRYKRYFSMSLEEYDRCLRQDSIHDVYLARFKDMDTEGRGVISMLSLQEHCLQDPRNSTQPGLSWENVGKAKPTTGTEIHNRRLESALVQGQEFTKDELDAFQLCSLSYSTYIKVGDSYFQPKTTKDALEHWCALHFRMSKSDFEKFLKQESGCGKRDYGACKTCVTCLKAINLETEGNGAGAAKLFWECTQKVQQPCSKCAPGADAFTHTNAVINSALVKLSGHTPLAPERKLYRGINGMSFAERLLKVDELEDFAANRPHAFRDTCKGFVELGFSSATPEKKVALDYSGAKECKGTECNAFNHAKGYCEGHKATVDE